MLICRKNFGFLATIVVGFCGIARAAHGPYAAPHCCSPPGVPCVPRRVTYGYVPTTWRRWPTAEVEAGAGQPEALPTLAPATQPAPEVEPESPEIAPGLPLEPTRPEGTTPEQPVRPPFDEGPLKLPFDEAPLPFDDAPPGLSAEGEKTPQPFIDPTVPPDATPSDEMPEPPGRQELPALDEDLPPMMPDEDPFKDDPESDIGAPPTAAPKPSESTRDEVHRALQPAASRWHVASGAPPGRLRASDAMPISASAEPRHLETEGENAESALLPGRRRHVNPLRRTAQTSRPKTIVPTASFSGAATATAGFRGPTWRRNPLRSN